LHGCCVKLEILTSLEDDFFGVEVLRESHSLRQRWLDGQSLALIGDGGMGNGEWEVKTF